MKMQSILAVLLVSSVVAIVAPAARAGALDGHVDFPAGTFSLDTWTGYVSAKGNGLDEILGSASVGVGWYLYDNLSLNVEVGGYHVTQDGPDADAASLGIIARHSLLSFGDRLSLFADVGISGFYASEQVPQGGTNFNYCFRTGPGVMFKLRDNVYLMGGAHYFHISNASLESPQHNPSINGVEGWVGVMFTF